MIFNLMWFWTCDLYIFWAVSIKTSDCGFLGCKEAKQELGPSPLSPLCPFPAHHHPSISAGGKENEEVAAHRESPTRCQDTQGLDRASPWGTQGDEAPNVLIFPGLGLLQQEVEDVQVAHAVCDEEHRSLVLVVHLLDQRLEVLEVFGLLLCGQEGSMTA